MGEGLCSWNTWLSWFAMCYAYFLQSPADNYNEHWNTSKSRNPCPSKRRSVGDWRFMIRSLKIQPTSIFDWIHKYQKMLTMKLRIDHNWSPIHPLSVDNIWSNRCTLERTISTCFWRLCLEFPWVSMPVRRYHHTVPSPLACPLSLAPSCTFAHQCIGYGLCYTYTWRNRNHRT